MKHKYDEQYGHHEKYDGSLGDLLDRCGHRLAHRVGGSKRGRGNVMAVIAQHPGISQKKLAETLEIQPASVSELLMKLEQKGLVLREKDEQDRRSMKVSLTEEGQAVLDKPREEPADPFQVLSSDEQSQLRVLLEKLLADWEERYPADCRKHRGHPHHNHHGKEHHHGKHE